MLNRTLVVVTDVKTAATAAGMESGEPYDDDQNHSYDSRKDGPR